MKQLKDYLHLYLGCEYVLSNDTSGQRAVLKSSNLTLFPDVIKPILRPLSDMTSEEAVVARQHWYMGETDTYLNEARRVKYLLSNHFDLFGLIEAELAIDKTTLTINPNP